MNFAYKLKDATWIRRVNAPTLQLSVWKGEKVTKKSIASFEN